MKSKLFTVIAFVFCMNLSFSNVIIINGLTHSYSGVSGQTFQGQIILANTSHEDQRVTFNLSEAIYSCVGGRIFDQDVQHKNSSTEWFEGATMDKVLGPKEKYIFKYSITVPNDSKLNGSYWTTLMVNVEKPIREETVSNIGLDTKIRYAVRLLTDVNVKENVNIDFVGVNLSLNSVNRKKQLEIQISNQSIFIENVKLSLEIYDAYGNMLLETETKRAKVFPEVCRDFIVDVSGLPLGTYQCVVMADSREEYVGTNMNLIIE